MLMYKVVKCTEKTPFALNSSPEYEIISKHRTFENANKKAIKLADHNKEPHVYYWADTL